MNIFKIILLAVIASAYTFFAYEASTEFSPVLAFIATCCWVWFVFGLIHKVVNK